jgi:hypothetical protein
VYIHIFRDAHKPLSVLRHPSKGSETTPGLFTGLTLGAKGVALGTIAHSHPEEDNGQITTVPSRHGISPVERLSGVTLHNLFNFGEGRTVTPDF